MFDLKTYLDNKLRIINDALSALPWEEFCVPGRLSDAMRYSLMAGGKRIRPILFLASAEAVGCFDHSSIIHAACAIEAIHTYSLIHDDLPAMDNDNLRRGKPTCHIQFDEATAILAGDALLTLAFQMIASPSAVPKIPAESKLHAIEILSAAAGARGMVAGQALDLISEGHQLGLEELKRLHAFKTGALIEASVVCGALLAGGDKRRIQALSEYGRNIGLAFQVADDMLNIEGDPLLMGKPSGTDAKHEKNTFPQLMGMEGSKQFAAGLIRKALDSLAVFDETALPLRKIAGYIIERNK